MPEQQKTVTMDADGQENFREFMANRSSALLKTAVLLSGGDRHAAAEDLLQNTLTANEEYVHWFRFNDAGLSPDGKLVAGDYAGDNKKSATSSSTPTPASGSPR